MKLINKILETIECLRWAQYAAHLARNGQISQAQACYTNRESVSRGL